MFIPEDDKFVLNINMSQLPIKYQVYYGDSCLYFENKNDALEIIDHYAYWIFFNEKG